MKVLTLEFLIICGAFQYGNGIKLPPPSLGCLWWYQVAAEHLLQGAVVQCPQVAESLRVVGSQSWKTVLAAFSSTYSIYRLRIL